MFRTFNALPLVDLEVNCQ